MQQTTIYRFILTHCIVYVCFRCDRNLYVADELLSFYCCLDSKLEKLALGIRAIVELTISYFI